MHWDQVAGQDKAKAFIKEVFQKGRVPHAILISGPSGTGQLPFALSLAALLQCEQPVEASPCGNCNACGKSFQLIHPDVNFIFPVANLDSNKRQVVDFLNDFRKAVLHQPYLSLEDWVTAAGIEKKNPNINIADIRSVIHTLSMSRYEGRKRVMLIWLPEYLGKEGNVLLKLIEEPEEHTHLLLVTADKDAILPTIRSRCQAIDTVLLDDKTIAQALEQQYQCSPERAQQAAWLSNGSFHTALASIEESNDPSSADFLQWLRIGYKGHPEEVTSWADEFGSWSLDKQRHFLKYGLHFLEQCLKSSYFPEEEWRLSDEEKDAVKKLGTILTFEAIQELTQLINKDLYYIGRSANSKMLMMGSTIQAHQLIKPDARR